MILPGHAWPRPPWEMSALLESSTLGQVRHVAQEDIGDAGTWHRSYSLRPIRLSMIAHATVTR